MNNVVFTQTPKDDRRRKYPYFGVFSRADNPEISGNQVVLFTGPSTGVVVRETTNTTGSKFPIGEYKSDWIEDFFIPVSGKLEITYV